MATPFRVVVRELAKHVNALLGPTPTPAQTNYLASPLTKTEIDDPKFQIDWQTDIVADTHNELAWAIAAAVDARGIGCHPWRSFFSDTTDPISHPGMLPLFGASGVTIIGALGRPYDAIDIDQIMTPGSVERISRYKNHGAIYSNNPYLYSINGTVIYHTTGNIVFDCCVYERSAIAALIAADGDFGNYGTVPDILCGALVAGSVAKAVITGQNLDQAAVFSQYYQAALNAIRAGSVNMPGLTFAMEAAA